MATEINTHNNPSAFADVQTAGKQSASKQPEKAVLKQPQNAPEQNVGTNSQGVNSGTQPAQNISKEELQSAVKELETAAKAQNRNLQFSVHEETGRTLVKVIDGDTEKVIRQIPSEVALDLATRMQEGKGSILEELA